jgi:hypothetical protein
MGRKVLIQQNNDIIANGHRNEKDRDFSYKEKQNGPRA